jgi:serine/threonine-protein kinase
MAIYRSGFETCPTDGAELAPATSDPLIGTTIAGQYVIDECVGEGAMGRVYRAHNARLTKRKFAIKVLLGDLAADPTMRKRFGQEAEAASRLQHPNVVSVLDFGKTDEGLHYLVMDFVEGGNLTDRMLAGPLSEQESVEIAKQVCLGLTHAHEQGLVHRDFKPDNVALVEHDGKTIPQILDFGLAIISSPEESSVRLTSAGLVVGTPAYLSPEQAGGRAVDQRTDLFAFGVSLFEMLSGTLPFDGNVIDMLYKNANVEAPSILERSGIEVSAELEAIVARLMAKDPGERFATARELLAALEAIEAPSEKVARVVGAAAPRGKKRAELESARTMAAEDSLPHQQTVLDSASTGDVGQIAELDSQAPARSAKPGLILGAIGIAALSAYLVLGGEESRPTTEPAPVVAQDVREEEPVVPALEIDEVEQSGSEEVVEVVLDAAVPEEKDGKEGRAQRARDRRKPPKTDKPRTPPKPTPRQKPKVQEVAQVPVPDPPVVKLEPKVEPKPVPPEPALPPKPKVPTSFKGKVAIVKFSAKGSLPSNSFERAVRLAIPALEKCYETNARVAKRIPTFGVNVSFIVAEQSRRIEKLTLSPKPPFVGMGSCIKKSIKKVGRRFSIPDTGPQRVSFLLHFAPKK